MHLVYILSAFQSAFWVHCKCILSAFWCILGAFWVHFWCILSAFWYTPFKNTFSNNTPKLTRRVSKKSTFNPDKCTHTRIFKSNTEKWKKNGNGGYLCRQSRPRKFRKGAGAPARIIPTNAKEIQSYLRFPCQILDFQTRKWSFFLLAPSETNKETSQKITFSLAGLHYRPAPRFFGIHAKVSCRGVTSCRDLFQRRLAQEISAASIRNRDPKNVFYTGFWL